MNYDQFKTAVKERIAHIYPDKEINIFEVTKNNNVKLDGLTITDDDTVITPTIYLNDFYLPHLKEPDPAAAAAEIMELYINYEGAAPEGIERLSDYCQIKEKIICKLVHFDKNQELLKTIPYRPFLDLAVVFCCLLDGTPDRQATMLIQNAHLQLWGINEEQLYQQALENTRSCLGYEIKTIGMIIKELFMENIKQEIRQMAEWNMEASFNEDELEYLAVKMYEEQEEYDENLPMYVLTNSSRINGAAGILYQDILEELSEVADGDYYILPSSIHEIIAVSRKAVKDCGDLQAMVKEINQIHVQPEEVLSDRVYYYNSTEKSICF